MVHALQCIRKHTKWLIGWLPTGNKLLQWNVTTNNLCPRCGQPELSKKHTISFKHIEAIPIWHKFRNELIHWLTNKHTHPALQRNILQNLKAWYDDRPSPTTPSDWPGITNLMHQQHQAGWTSFFTSCLTDGWADTHQAYYVFLKNVIPADDGQSNLFTNFG
jgi:hypothetical protein